MSALLQAPSSGDLAHHGAISDHTLVAAVRRGDERAFESLYERYNRRIQAYVFGMVKDHQRAEDVTQEVFVSALRRMRATERPIAFKPWIYEIAKNACIDQFRRSKRAEEVSIDADDGLAPSDYGRLVSHEPVPDAALVAKEQLGDLCGAFGGLSDAHHQILVLRELEGLSYKQIGEKMGMSRPAVESTLFRARRRLTQEYDELASGQRCLRIQTIITSAGSGRLGARDTRRLARHVAHCQPCRREAVAAGVDAALLARRPARQRIAEKVAALFPFPFLLRGRKGGGSSSEGLINQLPVVSEQAAAGTAKLVTAAVVLIAGLSAGIDSHRGTADASRDRSGDRPATTSGRDGTQRSGAERVSSARVAPVSRERGASGDRRRGDNSSAKRGLGAGGGVKTPASAPRKEQPAGQTPASAGGSGGGGQESAVPRAVRDQAGGVTQTPDTGRAPRIDVNLPPVQLPLAGPESQLDPQQVVGDAVGAVQQTGAAVQGAAGEAVQDVNDTVDGVNDAAGDVAGALPLQP